MELVKQLFIIFMCIFLIWFTGRVWYFLYKVYKRINYAIKYRTMRSPMGR